VTQLKLSDITDEKSVRLTIEVSVRLHRELLAYAAVLNNGEAKDAPDPRRLIPPMIERFMATDRDFARLRKDGPSRSHR